MLLVQALQRRYRFKSYDSFTVSSYGEKEREEDGKGTDRRHLFQRDAHTVDMKAVLLDVEEARYAAVSLHSHLHTLSRQVVSSTISYEPTQRELEKRLKSNVPKTSSFRVIQFDEFFTRLWLILFLHIHISPSSSPSPS